MYSESRFFVLIREGDKKAFEILFKTYYSQLCAYANTFVQDTNTAEDIVQDFLFHLWRKREELNVNIPIRPYLFKSVHNSCLNYLRHNKTIEKHKVITLQEYKEDCGEISDEAIDELHDKVRQTIDKLPPERRRVFIMHRYDELKYKEIAEKLNISVKTVENQIGKALSFLREELKNALPIIIVFYVFYTKYFCEAIGVNYIISVL